jgi:hypothetical protein
MTHPLTPDAVDRVGDELSNNDSADSLTCSLKVADARSLSENFSPLWLATSHVKSASEAS